MDETSWHKRGTFNKRANGFSSTSIPMYIHEVFPFLHDNSSHENGHDVLDIQYDIANHIYVCPALLYIQSHCHVLWPKCYDAEGQDPVEGVDKDDVHHVQRADHRAAGGGPEDGQKLSHGSQNFCLGIRAG